MLGSCGRDLALACDDLEWAEEVEVEGRVGHFPFLDCRTGRPCVSPP